MIERLREDITRQKVIRDSFPEGSENWLFYERDIKRMEELLDKEYEDERWEARSWRRK